MPDIHPGSVLRRKMAGALPQGAGFWTVDPRGNGIAHAHLRKAPQWRWARLGMRQQWVTGPLRGLTVKTVGWGFEGDYFVVTLARW